MAITRSPRSAGKVLGFEVSGEVTTQDYEVLTPAVEAAVREFGTVRLLCDLTGFQWEKVSAWGSDFHFGHEFHHKIERMAIVGDKKWEEMVTHLAAPFYAQEARFFDDEDAAFAWLEA